MKKKKALIIALVQILFLTGTGYAQTLPVGIPVLEDAYRREQLLGITDSLISFTIRPLFAGDQLNSGN
jgi:hypothetical protein